MADLKVKDEEYKELARLYREYHFYAEQHIKYYCDKLAHAASAGISSGKAQMALLQFCTYAVNLKGQVEGILEDMAKRCEDYCAEVDSIDQDVY